MLEISPETFVRLLIPFPIETAKIINVIPILIVCPTNRIVPKVAEAVPYSGGFTELITAFVLGEENNPNPIPNTTSIARMNIILVLLVKNTNASRPAVVKAMPTEATIDGCILSLNFPAIGDMIVIIIG